MSVLAALAFLDGAVGVYLLWYAVRRQRRKRDALTVVALVLLGCAVVLGYLALPADEPRGLLPASDRLV